MKEIFDPPTPVELEVAHAYPPMITGFFRGGSYLPLAFKFATDRAGEEPDLSLASVGCSNGAEVDSLLALYNRSGREGIVTATGYDVNPVAIRAAEQGYYRALDWETKLELPQEGALKPYGFATGYEQKGRFVPRFRLEVDAQPVRSGHTVNFVEHDGAEPLPVEGTADLVLANNILYHLTDERAARILYNMGRALSDRGVLALGNGTFAADSPLRTQPLVNMLKREFDLEPVFTNASETPIIFARG